MGQRRRLLLTYDAAAVPEGGAAVFAKLTSLTCSYSKDPAGHIYHEKALKQAGLFGEWLGECFERSEALPCAARHPTCTPAHRLTPFSHPLFPLLPNASRGRA